MPTGGHTGALRGAESHDLPLILLTEDVARLLRYPSTKAVARAAAAGRIPGALPRSSSKDRWRFSRDAVLEFIRTSTEGAA